MKKSLLFFIVAVLPIAKLAAQNDADVLRYSMLNYGSTARSLAMGNSFGALGADFSCLAMNPAGIGLYRRSEFSISPLFSNRATQSEYLGNSLSDDFFKFSFGNLGIVWAGTRDKAGSPWKGFAFGIGYNKTNDFNGRTVAEGLNPKNSLLTNYLESIGTLDNDFGFPIPVYEATISPNGIYENYPFDIDLAWQTFLIDSVENNGTAYYYSAIPFGGALQRKTTETRGGMGEWDFTFGGNYNDQLYVGFTLGLTTIRYVEESTWEEIDEEDTIPGFRDYTLYQNLETTGSGVNLKFGMIYRPADFFRVGLTIHSPTWNSLVDQYSTRIRTDLEDGQIRDYSGPVFIPFDYNINTPFRAIGSMGFIIAQQGALNVDYEFTDYSMGRVRPLDRSFASEFAPVNNAVSKKYGISHQLRAGFEWRYEQMRFRFGGHYATSPFASAFRPAQEIDQSRYGVSGGLGYRGEKYYFDAAYAWTKTGSFTLPYSLNNQITEGISFDQTEGRVMLTIGYLF